jgi:hypothetical protein
MQKTRAKAPKPRRKLTIASKKPKLIRQRTAPKYTKKLKTSNISYKSTPVASSYTWKGNNNEVASIKRKLRIGVQLESKSTFTIQSPQVINLSNTALSDWVAQLSGLYQKYTIHKLVFHWVPDCGNDTSGSIFMGFTPNSTMDEPSSASTFDQLPKYTNDSIRSACSLSIPCDNKARFLRDSSDEPLFTDVGKVFFATEKCDESKPSPGFIVMELQATFTVPVATDTVTNTVGAVSEFMSSSNQIVAGGDYELIKNDLEAAPNMVHLTPYGTSSAYLTVNTPGWLEMTTIPNVEGAAAHYSTNFSYTPDGSNTSTPFVPKIRAEHHNSSSVITDLFNVGMKGIGYVKKGMKIINTLQNSSSNANLALNMIGTTFKYLGNVLPLLVYDYSIYDVYCDGSALEDHCFINASRKQGNNEKRVAYLKRWSPVYTQLVNIMLTANKQRLSQLSMDDDRYQMRVEDFLSEFIDLFAEMVDHAVERKKDVVPIRSSPIKELFQLKHPDKYMVMYNIKVAKSNQSTLTGGYAYVSSDDKPSLDPICLKM